MDLPSLMDNAGALPHKALGQAGACPQLHSPSNNEGMLFLAGMKEKDREAFKIGSITLPRLGHYVDNNSAPTIISNLLEANAVLSWHASYQKAKRFGPLLWTTIGHTPAC
jgi:hypothetical protein